ncbi:hypothetical protein [Massilia timonae]|uniref:hypothetical protein n=1 Tax=Massilia timonae TaxID=47229 RepID=UPI0028976615|nr:hypothetical protein [Massilia timonae]
MKNTNKGFAGLGNKVSDVSDVDAARSTVPAAPSAPQSKPLAKPAQPDTNASATSVPPFQPRKTHETALKDDSKATKTAAYFWGTVAVIVLAFWVLGDGSSSRSPERIELSSTDTSNSPTTEEIGHTPAPAPEPVESNPSRPESKPAVAQGAVLNVPEIRWCKRRQIELESIQGILDGERQSEVAAFNSMVEDYNSRCSNFRYRRGNVEQVEREFASESAIIKKEAQSVWVRTVLGLDKENDADLDLEPEMDSEPDDRSASRAPAKPSAQNSTLTIDSLNSDERESLESACSSAKVLEGPAAFARCQKGQLAKLASSPRNIDLSALNRDELESIESSCSQQKVLYGPAAYNKCLVTKLAAWKTAPHNIDLSALNRDEYDSIQSSCSQQKVLYGPAAYNQCLSSKLAAWKTAPRNIDLSTLNPDERDSIESACSTPRVLEGPAAYNRCLTKKLKQLRS